MLRRLGIGIAVVLGTITFLFIALVVLGLMVGDNSTESTDTSIMSINRDGECRLGMSADTYYSLSESEYEKHLRDLGCMSEEVIQTHLQQFRDPEKRARELAQMERWKEQYKHWDYLNAFDEHIREIYKDNVVDESEWEFICSVVHQWDRQLKEAQVYVQEYRLDDPETVSENSALANLETRADEASEVVSTIFPVCELR